MTHRCLIPESSLCLIHISSVSPFPLVRSSLFSSKHTVILYSENNLLCHDAIFIESPSFQYKTSLKYVYICYLHYLATVQFLSFLKVIPFQATERTPKSPVKTTTSLHSGFSKMVSVNDKLTRPETLSHLRPLLWTLVSNMRVHSILPHMFYTGRDSCR